ncbi:lipoprotein [Streptomyces ruber]|uniref:Lipoprotein n=2 Tax=Streptomyces TaxID=1883 RepID=A0A918BD85_9ACTN|nr:hypothetical protein [Streptomyces ruber]GGQ60449.1 lipoprotein [Streptomyces ruber]
MRGTRVASAALLGVAALTFSSSAAGAAVAGDITSFGFSVSPSTVAAGGRVTLHVDGCRRDARVSSSVFDTVTVPKGRRAATATVDWDARPGAVYEVTFRCGHETGHTDLTIAKGRPSGHPTHLPPDRGSHTGVGGEAGVDAGEIGLGAALVAGTLAAAYGVSRRRPTGDRS